MLTIYQHLLIPNPLLLVLPFCFSFFYSAYLCTTHLQNLGFYFSNNNMWNKLVLSHYLGLNQTFTICPFLLWYLYNQEYHQRAVKLSHNVDLFRMFYLLFHKSLIWICFIIISHSSFILVLLELLTDYLTLELQIYNTFFTCIFQTSY